MQYKRSHMKQLFYWWKRWRHFKLNFIFFNGMYFLFYCLFTVFF